MTPSPLADIRVLDIGTHLATSFCAGILAEQGADVIKVEQPGSGDPLRAAGPFTEEGHSLFWAVEGRARRSVTCDMSHPRGQRLFTRLAPTADVVIESFAPGTLERWGLGAGTLDPRVVLVRITPFGQDGPYAHRAGSDQTGAALGGLLHLNGDPDRPPLRTGVDTTAYLTGALAAQATVAALYDRDARGTGRGRVIDAPLYGAALRTLEWTVAAHDRLGSVRTREGNRQGDALPVGAFRTGDDRHVWINAGTDEEFTRLCQAMDRQDLAANERFKSLPDRARHADDLHRLVAAWLRQRTASEVERLCAAHDVSVSTVYTAADIAVDPHLEIRGDLVTVEDAAIGPVRQQAPYPRLDERPPPAPAGAPRLGEHNTSIWCDELGLTPDELAELQDAGVV